MELRTVRFTSKYLNDEKFKIIYEIDTKVLKLKNEMSKYIFENVDLLLTNERELLKHYKNFNNDFLSAWETQGVYQDIIKFYNNALQKHKQNIDFKIQKSTKTTFYKINTKNHQKGDIKTFEVKKKKTNLCKAVKYLCYCDVSDIENLPSKIVENYRNKSWFPKMLNFVKEKQKQLTKKLKLITFSTGTYRKIPKHGSKIFKDESNSLYKWWFSYKVRKEIIYIPLQINKKYHKDIEKLLRFDSEVYVKINKNKVEILTTKEFNQVPFKEFHEILGCDLNVKHNFCYFSNNVDFDYDRKFIQIAVKQLHKLDKKFIKSEKDKKKLSKICRQNESYFKSLIFRILNYLENEQITDVVLEDLNLSFGATFIKHPDFDIKYSRLVRLLRLSNVKTWFKSQANKRGIRVHLTNPAYTSQTCPMCYCVSRENRKSQENFKCISCGYHENADFNSAINIKDRFVSNVLKHKLHNFDDNNQMIPKRMKLNTVKEIIQALS